MSHGLPSIPHAAIGLLITWRMLGSDVASAQQAPLLPCGARRLPALPALSAHACALLAPTLCASASAHPAFPPCSKEHVAASCLCLAGSANKSACSAKQADSRTSISWR